MRSQPIAAYYSESTDIAEIHSMAMEQFAYPYAEKFFGEQADKYRFAHLQDALTFDRLVLQSMNSSISVTAIRI